MRPLAGGGRWGIRFPGLALRRLYVAAPCSRKAAQGLPSRAHHAGVLPIRPRAGMSGLASSLCPRIAPGQGERSEAQRQGRAGGARPRPLASPGLPLWPWHPSPGLYPQLHPHSPHLALSSLPSPVRATRANSRKQNRPSHAPAQTPAMAPHWSSPSPDAGTPGASS